ncbi:hypothetical protein PFDG_04578 [Plasmodium falciparum Dd2]|uniref:Uncharacterized protein n=1 Tax=Plasmodium falciparum (isolate Dd2) TaxID=57267 RepID=A0A0L7M5E2_PLAF4|nr:hypothetical protein PFDG_04578 [Plasmodium falciparum Dd2]
MFYIYSCIWCTNNTPIINLKNNQMVFSTHVHKNIFYEKKREKKKKDNYAHTHTHTHTTKK